jgi:hypothetical protein
MKQKFLRRSTRVGQPSRRSPGRPTKLTKAVRAKFLESIHAGNHRQTAAAYAGIGVSTMYRWMADEHEPYRTFRNEVELAEAEFEQATVAIITSHFQTDAKLAMRFLEKRFPSRWSSTPIAQPAEQPSPPPNSPAVPEIDDSNVIHISREQLERIGLENLHEQQRKDGTALPDGYLDVLMSGPDDLPH